MQKPISYCQHSGSGIRHGVFQGINYIRIYRKVKKWKLLHGGLLC